MPKITPFLWFNDQAEEAVNFYTSLFKHSKIHHIVHYGEGSPGEPGKVMTISFELDGQAFTALNGGPHFTFSPATSFYVNCDNQDEVDLYWNALSDGGEIQQCGWLTDKFGVTWQIVPTILGELLGDPDPVKSQRVMQAMLGMIKLDIPTLQQAYDQP